MEIQITGLTQMIGFALKLHLWGYTCKLSKGWESIPEFAGCASAVSLKYEENSIKRI